MLEKFLSNPGEEGEENHGGLSTLVQLIVFVSTMTMYVVLDTYLEHKNFWFGHAASLVMFLGLIFSVFALIKGIAVGGFSETAILDFAVPIIILNDGYNMRKQRFFKELPLINRHGLYTNFFNFLLILPCMIWLMKFDWVKTSFKYNAEEDSW